MTLVTFNKTLLLSWLRLFVGAFVTALAVD